MEKPRIIFVHGWGCGPDIWGPVIQYLDGFECLCVDLGFVGVQDLRDYDNAPAVYVTHSLGTLWALRHRAKKMKMLIVINGFSQFKPFTDVRTLKAMHRHLKRNPQAQMNDFWIKAGLPQHKDLNVDRLEEGLKWLINWDCRDDLNALSCPVLSLIGAEDAIADYYAMKAHWQEYKTVTCSHGGHNLPTAHPDFCAQHILEAINGF